MTIHKGLGNKGKGNRIPVDNCEDYTILVNLSKVRATRDEYFSLMRLVLLELNYYQN